MLLEMDARTPLRCLRLLVLSVALGALPIGFTSSCGDDSEDIRAGDTCSGDMCAGEGSDYLSCGGDGKWRRVTDPACTCTSGKEACQ